MKARKYSRRILNGEVRPNVLAIQDSGFMTDDFIDYVAQKDQHMKADLTLLRSSLKDAKEYGSILHMPKLNFAALYERIDIISRSFAEDMFQISYQNTAVEQLLPLVKQAEIMAQKYDVVVTNPPYMVLSNANTKLADYAAQHYPNSKTDLFAVFIQRNQQFSKKQGFFALVTMHSWMFLSSYNKLREHLLLTSQLVNMAHLGMRAFDNDVGTIVQTATFVYRNCAIDSVGTYIDLTKGNSPEAKNEALLAANAGSKLNHYASNSLFRRLPGTIYAYWATTAAIKAFGHKTKIETVSETRIGMATADNDRFVRLWYEVDVNKANFDAVSRIDAAASAKKWFPYCKGGAYRKWYGNMSHFVNWENDGLEIQNFRDEKTGRVRSHNYNLDYIFKPGFTFTAISNDFSCRTMNRALFGSGGSGICAVKQNFYYGLLGLLNSKLILHFMKMLSQTMNFEVNQVGSVPVFEELASEQVNKLVQENISTSKDEWDSFETSWDFKKHPLI